GSRPRGVAGVPPSRRSGCSRSSRWCCIVAAGRTAPDPAARIADAEARLLRALSRSIRLTPAIAAEAAAIRGRYHGAGPPPVLAARASVAAYAAARMPATFGATARALAEAAARLPDFAPRTLLDVGAGTGASTWAASAVWPSIRGPTLVERDPAAI